MLMRRNTSLVFSFIPVLLGVYIILNDDFLSVYGLWDDYGVGWIDDSTFGFILVALGICLFISFMVKNIKVQSMLIIALGAALFSVFLVYLYRAMLGFHNLTWIFSLSVFLLLYSSIEKAGDRKYVE